MAQEIIFRKLNSAAEKVKSKYKPKNIFAVFYYGRAKLAAIVVPTFSDLCLDKKYILSSVSNIKIFDIRYLLSDGEEKNELLEALFSEYYYINPKYEYLYLNSFLKFKEDFQKGNEKVIASSVIKLIKIVCHNNSTSFKFIKRLNDVEKTAIERIVAEIGDEGIISQAKVASASGISRAAMTHLMLKMNVGGVAEITYMGKKGTHIKILDDSLINIRG